MTAVLLSAPLPTRGFSIRGSARVVTHRRCSFCKRVHRAEDSAIVVNGQLRTPTIVCQET